MSDLGPITARRGGHMVSGLDDVEGAATSYLIVIGVRGIIFERGNIAISFLILMVW